MIPRGRGQVRSSIKPAYRPLYVVSNRFGGKEDLALYKMRWGIELPAACDTQTHPSNEA